MGYSTRIEATDFDLKDSNNPLKPTDKLSPEAEAWVSRVVGHAQKHVQEAELEPEVKTEKEA